MTRNQNNYTFICTLGGSWAVVPEILGCLMPDVFNVYPKAWLQNNKHLEKPYITEVWIITTSGKTAFDSTDKLKSWWDSIKALKPTLRIYRLARIEDIVTDKHNMQMAELIYRIAFQAWQRGDIIWSLAGGRKTMSSIIQKAASVFGAKSLYHVVSDSKVDSFTRGDFSFPLPDEIANDLHIVDMGGYRYFEGLDWHTAEQHALRPDDFKLQPASDNETYEIEVPVLYSEIEMRQRDAAVISKNYFFELMRADQRENFRSLYRLPSTAIERLREEYIGASLEGMDNDIDWIRQLPKAELHCHLGGIAAPDELKTIAAAIIKAYSCDNRSCLYPFDSIIAEGFEKTRHFFDEFIQDKEKKGVSRDLATALFIDSASAELLDIITRVGNSDCQVGAGLLAYRRAGDIQGSALLRTKEAITTACQILHKKAVKDNVKYLEVRCSPANYCNDNLDARSVLTAIRDGFRTELFSKCHVELIIIGTRHGDEKLFKKHVELAVWAADEWKESPRVVGFDLAGEESTKSPAEIRALFEPIFKRCLKLTIHAGETESAENVWEAVYHLNADRIGHGLKLIDNSKLFEYIRDRGVAVELCPTSNDQVVGFHDYLRDKEQLRSYPLKTYIDKGLRVTICTDNPGISRTNWSNELYKAARLVKGGLSKWQILAIIRAGFQSAFLPQPERAELLKKADQMVYEAVAENRRESKWMKRFIK